MEENKKENNNEELENENIGESEREKDINEVVESNEAKSNDTGNNQENKEETSKDINKDVKESMIVKSESKSSKTKNKRKIIIYSLITFIIISLVTGGLYYQHKKKVEETIKLEKEQYRKDLSALVDEMLENGVKAESMINEYLKVWNKAIDERYSWTLHGERVYDFNDALRVQYNYFKNHGDIKSLIDKNIEIELKIKSLNNPPIEYKEMYDLVIELYTDYSEFVELAEEPSGSYRSYSANANELSSNFVRKIKEFNVRFPDIQ